MFSGAYCSWDSSFCTTLSFLASFYSWKDGDEGDDNGVTGKEGINSGLIVVIVVAVLVLLSSFIGDLKIWPSIKYSLKSYD